MADIRKDNVEIYIKEMILKEIGSNSYDEKVLWDRRRQWEELWATKEKEIEANEKNRKKQAHAKG